MLGNITFHRSTRAFPIRRLYLDRVELEDSGLLRCGWRCDCDGSRTTQNYGFQQRLDARPAWVLCALFARSTTRIQFDSPCRRPADGTFSRWLIMAAGYAMILALRKLEFQNNSNLCVSMNALRS